MKYPLKYGRERNSITYSSDTVTFILPEHNCEMNKRLHPPVPKKDNPGIAQNYRGIIFTSIAAKVYNTLPLNRIEQLK